MSTTISIIAALGKNRAIGKNNQLLWHLPEDLKRFKTLTMGHPVIMGRKTFDSIVSVLGKPLPDRTNIVITRNADWAYAGAEVAHTLEEALSAAKALGDSKVFIIGGAQIYAQALPLADRLYLTLVDAEKDADAFFPAYEHLFPKKILRGEGVSPEGIGYQWIDYEQ